jgi:hypothetical protein
MLGDSRQASSATTALIYLTVGGLIDVWSIVYLFYLRTHDGTDIAYLYAYGFIFSGFVLFLIGLAVGRIGYSARSAEVAPMPTQQVVTAAAMAPVPPLAVAAGPNTPSAPAASPRPAPVVTTDAGPPAESYALSGKSI